MLAASAFATTTGRARKSLLAFAAAMLVVYSVWMVWHSDYIYVIADTGTALILVAVLHLRLVAGDHVSRWILAGVGVSVLAGAVQASGFALHRHFNHNDLHRVIQIAATVLFYVGAKRLRDRS